MLFLLYRNPIGRNFSSLSFNLKKKNNNNNSSLRIIFSVCVRLLIECRSVLSSHRGVSGLSKYRWNERKSVEQADAYRAPARGFPLSLHRQLCRGKFALTQTALLPVYNFQTIMAFVFFSLCFGYQFVFSHSLFFFFLSLANEKFW